MRPTRLQAALVVLSLAGVAVAGYLTYVHYAGLQPLCLASGGCETVQASRHARVFGLPVALYGLLGYLAILASLRIPGDAGRLVGLGLTYFGFGYSLYLTYLEIFRIKAICQWCVASAVIMTLLAALMTIRWLRARPA